jgi:hypothetical protein
MDLAYDDMYGYLVLGLNRRQGHFKNFLGVPIILYAPSVFLVVNAGLCWLNNFSGKHY